MYSLIISNINIQTCNVYIYIYWAIHTVAIQAQRLWKILSEPFPPANLVSLLRSLLRLARGLVGPLWNLKSSCSCAAGRATFEAILYLCHFLSWLSNVFNFWKKESWKSRKVQILLIIRNQKEKLNKHVLKPETRFFRASSLPQLAAQDIWASRWSGSCSKTARARSEPCRCCNKAMAVTSSTPQGSRWDDNDPEP